MTDTKKLAEKVGFARILTMVADSQTDISNEYIMKKYEIVLGRNSKSSSADISLGEWTTSAAINARDEFP